MRHVILLALHGEPSSGLCVVVHRVGHSCAAVAAPVGQKPETTQGLVITRAHILENSHPVS